MKTLREYVITPGLNRSLAARAAERSPGRMSSLHESKRHAVSRASGEPLCISERSGARAWDEGLDSVTGLKVRLFPGSRSTHPRRGPGSKIIHETALGAIPAAS